MQFRIILFILSTLLPVKLTGTHDKKRKLETANTTTQSVLEQVTTIKDIQAIIAGYVGSKFMLEKKISGFKLGISSGNKVLAYCPNGKYLACIGTDSDTTEAAIKLWDAHSHKLIWNFTSPKSIYALAWSPNCEDIAIGTVDGLSIIQVTTKKQKKSHAAKPQSALGLRYSPNGRFIASSSHFDIFVWDSKKLQLLYTHNLKTLCPSALCFSPDSTQLAVSLLGGDIYILDNTNQKLLKKINALSTLDTPTLYQLDYSLDGKQLVGIESYATVFKFNVTTGAHISTQSKPEQTNIVNCAVYSPDGRYFITSDAQEITIWHAEQNLIIERITIDPDRCVQIACSPDSSHFAASFNSGKLEIWELPTQLTWQEPTEPNQLKNKRCRNCLICVIS